MKTSLKLFASVCALFCCLSISSQNMINMDDWVSGTSGTTTNYNLSGTATQNSRITMIGPYGADVTVWEASADGTAGINGGFAHSGVVLDTDKTYRISFWVQSTGLNNCSNYTGFLPYYNNEDSISYHYNNSDLIQPFYNENGIGVSWPYTSSIIHPNDRWFLVVGYVRPEAINDVGDSGIYEASIGTAPNLPSISYSTTDFIFPIAEDQIYFRLRSFMWNCAAGEKMFLYDPRIEEASAAIPLSNLLYGTNILDTSAPSSPTLISASKTETTVDLSWSGATDDTDVTGFKVYNNGTLEATLGNVNSYQVTGLAENTSYIFTVTALDEAGNESVLSNALTITTDTSEVTTSEATVWNKSSGGVYYNKGNVGIGTSSIPSDYNLAVNGKVISEELKVQLESNWPDYVFSEQYKLPSLEEVEKHIHQKGHLINIPSAQEVKAKGIELGNMNKLLLEKIEELTLYVIKLGETNNSLQEKIEELSLYTLEQEKELDQKINN